MLHSIPRADRTSNATIHEHKMKKVKGLDAHVRHVALALMIAALVQADSALAALELRDINGNPTASAAGAEFAYDTILDATWYLTANNAGLDWDGAKTWAAGLTVGDFSGWSLPAADPDCVGFFGCTTSQLGELYYAALGNPAGGPLSNISPFKNLQSLSHWSGTVFVPAFVYPLAPDYAWSFDTTNGTQFFLDKRIRSFALALRPGDVAAVPEPGILALLLSGLVGMMVLRRRPVGL